MIAAAPTGCFSMTQTNALTQEGHSPNKISTSAGPDGFGIPKIDRKTNAVVPGISAEAFQETAQKAKKNCPVSRLLAAAEITFNAKLMS